MIKFYGVAEIAQAAGITRQAFHKVCRQFHIGRTRPWRGVVPEIRTAHGRGGRSGQSYEVRLDSLPHEIQARWKELHGPVEAPLKLNDATSAECQWRHALIQPALAAPKRSADRARIIKDIASREHINPKGRRERVSETSIQR